MSLTCLKKMKNNMKKTIFYTPFCYGISYSFMSKVEEIKLGGGSGVFEKEGKSGCGGAVFEEEEPPAATNLSLRN
jgi:hypothetical protein